MRRKREWNKKWRCSIKEREVIENIIKITKKEGVENTHTVRNVKERETKLFRVLSRETEKQ